MTTRPSLVPLDQPYGSRQQLVDQATQIGVPLSTAQVNTGPQLGPGGGGGPQPAPLRQGGNFDVLAGRQPSQTFQPIETTAPAADPSVQLTERLLLSPSPMLRELGRRLSG